MELNPLTEAALVNRLAQIHVATAVTETLATGKAPSGGGQIAQVAWDDSVFLFLVQTVSDTSVDGWFADIAIATTDKPDILGESVSFGEPLILGRSRVSLPAIAFAKTIGTTPAIGMGAGITSSGRAQTDPLDTVLATFQQLRGGTGTMPDLLKTHGFTLSRMKEALHIDSQAAFALLRGEEALTEDQASVIASEAGIAIEEIAAASPEIPDGLIDVLYEHHYRDAVSAAAKDIGANESAGWNRVARGALALAARKDAGAGINWHDRVDRFIETAGL